MSFDPVHFIPASRKEAILALPVEVILAVGHGQKENTNHWCFYVITSPNTSVRIDCIPSYSVPSTVLSGGSKANLVISELPCRTSRTAIKMVDLTVRQNLTVADVYNTLVQNGRHKYEFDRNGVGCRWWTSQQLDLLQTNHVVTNPQEVAAAKAAIVKLWPEGTPLALDEGAYYQ